MRLSSQSVERAGSDVEIGVGCTECEEQNACVENTRKVLDVGVLDRNNEGRGRGLSSRLVGIEELPVIVGDKHSQEEHTQAVEEQDPVERKLDGPWNGLAGILRFTDRDTNEFGTKVSEHSIDKRAPESIKSSSGTRINVFFEPSWVVVVLETRSIGGTSADSEKEAK
jgi:hypothetical protein